MNTLQYRPGTAKQRMDAKSSLNAGKMRDLRASHWGVGHSALGLSAPFNATRNSVSSKT